MGASGSDIAAFTESMQPYAVQAGQALGVSPDTILGQWALESGWGTSNASSGNNYGGLTVSGQGTGYRTFATPADFEAAFVGNIQRMHPLALNTGNDVAAYTQALSVGPGGAGTGSYFGTQSPGSYAADIQGAMSVNGAVVPGTPPTLMGKVLGAVSGAVGGTVAFLTANIGLVAFGLLLVIVLVQAGAKGVQRG